MTVAYDEALASRIADALADRTDVVERKMFGGLCFMVGGHMCCGVVRDDLMVRVGPDDYAEHLEQPGAREMDFTGRPMKGFLFVGPEGTARDADLRAWVERGLAFVGGLPGR